MNKVRYPTPDGDPDTNEALLAQMLREAGAADADLEALLGEAGENEALLTQLLSEMEADSPSLEAMLGEQEAELDKLFRGLDGMQT